MEKLIWANLKYKLEIVKKFSKSLEMEMKSQIKEQDHHIVVLKKLFYMNVSKNKNRIIHVLLRNSNFFKIKALYCVNFCDPMTCNG